VRSISIITAELVPAVQPSSSAKPQDMDAREECEECGHDYDEGTSLDDHQRFAELHGLGVFE
jgi:hypothetical protein